MASVGLPQPGETTHAVPSPELGPPACLSREDGERGPPQPELSPQACLERIQFMWSVVYVGEDG